MAEREPRKEPIDPLQIVPVSRMGAGIAIERIAGLPQASQERPPMRLLGVVMGEFDPIFGVRIARIGEGFYGRTDKKYWGYFVAGGALFNSAVQVDSSARGMQVPEVEEDDAAAFLTDLAGSPGFHHTAEKVIKDQYNGNPLRERFQRAMEQRVAELPHVEQGFMEALQEDGHLLALSELTPGQDEAFRWGVASAHGLYVAYYNPKELRIDPKETAEKSSDNRLIPVSPKAVERAVERFRGMKSLGDFIKGFKKRTPIFEVFQRTNATAEYAGDDRSIELSIAGAGFFQSAVGYEALLQHKQEPKLRHDAILAFTGDLYRFGNMIEEAEKIMAGGLNEAERDEFMRRIADEKARRMDTFSEVEPAVAAALDQKDELFPDGIANEEFEVFRWGAVNGHYLLKANYEAEEIQRATGVRTKFSRYLK